MAEQGDFEQRNTLKSYTSVPIMFPRNRAYVMTTRTQCVFGFCLAFVNKTLEANEIRKVDPVVAITVFRLPSGRQGFAVDEYGLC